MTIKSSIESNIPEFIINIYLFLKFRFWYRSGKRIWSQEGEDVILERVFKDVKNGFYVDVGAHHPYRYSNTYILYKRGWSGINIDPSPVAIDLFDKCRRRDRNLNIGISEVEGFFDFFIFRDGAYNTLSKEMADDVERIAEMKVKDVAKVETRRLESVLMDEVPSGKKINLMSVDVEGMDLEVLRSNNWADYSPDVLLVESQWKTLDEVLNGEVFQYLTQRDYTLYSKLVNTLVFVRSGFRV